MKKLALFITFLLCILTLSSCGTVEDVISGTNITQNKTETGYVNPTSSSDIDNTNVDPLSVEFKVTLTWMGQPMPIDEDIEVIWMNRQVEKRAWVSYDGVATTTGLDGEFSVHLSKAPKGYTYDPNCTVVSNDNPIAEIEIMKISKAKGNGTDLYDGIATITNITIKDKDSVGESYSYQATIKNESTGMFFEFKPKNPGVYTIESMVDVNDDLINPSVLIYNGTQQYKNPWKTLDDGGISKKGGYTKNFKYDYSIAEEELGGVTAFKIMATAKDGVYPVVVNFRITYVSFYEMEGRDSTLMFGMDLYAKRDSAGNIIYTVDQYGDKVPEYNYVLDADKSKANFKITYERDPINGYNTHGVGKINSYVTGLPVDDSQNNYIKKRYRKNADGTYTEDYANGTYILESPMKCTAYGSNYMDFVKYSGFMKNGYRILDGDRCYYNEADGYYHFDSINGPIICTKITTAVASLDLAFIHAEDPGNSCLKVFGKENYKRFIEAEYADICNSQGICYVTPELKEFLQKFSNSQCLFFDGNGYCETNSTYAEEENQWMFACGYYYG